GDRVAVGVDHGDRHVEGRGGGDAGGEGNHGKSGRGRGHGKQGAAGGGGRRRLVGGGGVVCRVMSGSAGVVDFCGGVLAGGKWVMGGGLEGSAVRLGGLAGVGAGERVVARQVVGDRQRVGTGELSGPPVSECALPERVHRGHGHVERRAGDRGSGQAGEGEG